MTLVAVALTAFTLSTKNLPLLAAALLNYFSCEQGGYDPEAPCRRSDFGDITAFSTLSHILVGLLPIVNLVYVLNFKELKKHCILCKSRSRFNLDSPSIIRGTKL